MKDNIIIEFDKIGKRFQIGQRLLLKQALLDLFKFDQRKDFWALKGVSFKIYQGQTVGIMGVNGSGKSSLLKLIAGVIVPTEGTLTCIGRISPLIELGAGFHPELSGRDNIYLNGTILGLSKREIDERFDDIVSFSELEKFIDTPVKHYSSGMYMRLGFSIAIHINPEILLVDEILSVGDLAFQKKCLDKIKHLKRKGLTMVFVSHSVDLIKELCDKVLLLDQGRLINQGDANKIASEYFSLSVAREEFKIEEKSNRWGDGKIKINKIWVDQEERIKIKFRTLSYTEAQDPIFGITLRNQNGVSVLVTNTLWQGVKTGNLKKGDEKIISWEFPNYLEVGKYWVSPAVSYSDGVRFFDWRDNWYSFEVKNKFKTGGILNIKQKVEII